MAHVKKKKVPEVDLQTPPPFFSSFFFYFSWVFCLCKKKKKKTNQNFGEVFLHLNNYLLPAVNGAAIIVKHAAMG